MYRKPKSGVYPLLFVVFSLFVLGKAFQTKVSRDKIITTGIFHVFEGVEWFGCFKKCLEEERCVSYNYGIGATDKTLCQMSSCGVSKARNCEAENHDLLYARGFVFQQLKSEQDGTMCFPVQPPPTPAANKDCYDVYNSGKTASNVYDIYPDGGGSIPVYCDQTTDGGGWTVFQKRTRVGALDFYKTWSDYELGFGGYDGEFWMGLDRLHRITVARGNMKLRIELTDQNDEKAFSEYTGFWVGAADDKYTLHVTFAGGSAGDSLTHHHNERQFSTKDMDNDACSTLCSCAERHSGAWWFDGIKDECKASDLNGQSIEWKTWNRSIAGTQMKFRPA